MSLLVLLRHGQSEWNRENRFTGWVDIPLSERGRQEARDAGMAIAHIDFARSYTSTLIRAQETLLIVLNERSTRKVPVFIHDQGRQKEWAHYTSLADNELPVIVTTALNERYYGDLQGLNKDEAKKKWGEEQVHLWRRSYAVAPPGGESLQDTCKRTEPYFNAVIAKDCREGNNVLVVAHGNSLRSIIKELDGLTDDEVADFEIATGVPRIYEVTSHGIFSLRV